MATIETSCPACGPVALKPAQVKLRVAPFAPERSSYAFTCPDCGSVVTKPATDTAVRLLSQGGVEVQVVPRSNAPRLTHDDLLDFHALLATDDWFDALLACC